MYNIDDKFLGDWFIMSYFCRIQFHEELTILRDSINTDISSLV